MNENEKQGSDGPDGPKRVSMPRRIPILKDNGKSGYSAYVSLEFVNVLQLMALALL
jgi:hypothetical protein